MMQLTIDDIQIAGVLRKRLALGVIDINELNAFLTRLERKASADTKKKTARSEKRQQLFLWHLNNLSKRKVTKNKT